MKSIIRRGLACVSLLLILLNAVCAAEAGQPHSPVTVSYLGPEGTYTQEATRRFFGEGGDYRPQKSVADAVSMMLDGESMYAVIPQENTIGGPVYDYLDELLAHDGLFIAGEVELPIRQALLVREGTRLEDIEVVYSHAQGITQGRVWLGENLPQAEVIEVSSTAEGARMVAESTDFSCAAVASAGAAELYGLQVFAESIQQNEDNKTRFYVLTDEAAGTESSDRMVFTAVGSVQELPDLLAAVEDAGLRLISLHDRPAKTVMGSYVYLIECENAGFADFESISAVPGFEFRYYGAFPVC